MEKLTEEEKEKNERVKEELKRAKDEGRHIDVSNFLRELKEGKDEKREEAKKMSFLKNF